VYERFDASSIAEADDARFDYFSNKVCACIGCLTVYWTWFHFDRSCNNEVFLPFTEVLGGISLYWYLPLISYSLYEALSKASFELHNPLNRQLQRIPGES
jgi:hypothetical protein